MFPVISNHYVFHIARQRELEADVQADRLSSLFVKESIICITRKRIGIMLIALGQKLAEQPGQDSQLVFSARR